MWLCYFGITWNSLQWRYNVSDDVSNHQPHDCLLNRVFRSRSKKTSKLRVTGLCEGNSPVTGEFPSQWDSKVEMFPFDDVIMWGSCLPFIKLIYILKWCLTIWVSQKAVKMLWLVWRVYFYFFVHYPSHYCHHQMMIPLQCQQLMWSSDFTPDKAAIWSDNIVCIAKITSVLPYQ